MSRVAVALLLAAAGLTCAACAGPGPGSQPAPDPKALDAVLYASDVHPIFEARCGTLDCHGNLDRPLRLFAVTGMRLDDALRPTTTITADELAQNIEAVAGFDAPPVLDDHLILLKPIGAMKHSGKILWTSTSDPQYVCVRGWLGGLSADPTVAAACATAAPQVKLPDPMP